FRSRTELGEVACRSWSTFRRYRCKRFRNFLKLALLPRRNVSEEPLLDLRLNQRAREYLTVLHFAEDNIFSFVRSGECNHHGTLKVGRSVVYSGENTIDGGTGKVSQQLRHPVLEACINGVIQQTRCDGRMLPGIQHKQRAQGAD